MERKHSFFLHCIIRKNRKNPKDTYPVFLRITVDSNHIAGIKNMGTNNLTRSSYRLASIVSVFRPNFISHPKS
jgi:hypothetical protein